MIQTFIAQQINELHCLNKKTYVQVLFQKWKIWEEHFASRWKFFKGSSNNSEPKAAASEETKMKDVQVANIDAGNKKFENK